jgi:carbon-monoxide dehydrogenase large subunit
MTAVPRAKYVGQAVKRREDARLLQGRGNFVADLKRHGTLHMALLRSPIAHAEIVGIDPTAARAAIGVPAVLTAADLADVGLLPCIDVYPDTKPALQSVLADGRVRYVGQPVAAVAARSAAQAAAAAELINVEYAALPPVVDLDDAAAGATLLYPEFGSNVVNTVHQDVGDVEAAFAAAHRTYSESFRIHRYGPMPMETRGVLAEIDPVSQRLVLHTATQFPHLLRTFLGLVLGRPDSSIRVVAPDVGGGFGGKLSVYPEEVLAALFALRLNKPVRWIESRAEHLVAARHAREQRHDLTVSVTAEGVITAMSVESWTNNGAALHTVGITPASISGSPDVNVGPVMCGTAA